MQSVEAEGTTIDEAIANALESLKVERDRVDVEILSDATRGLFGLGGKKARVRATLRAPIWDADKDGHADDDDRQPTEQSERRAESGGERSGRRRRSPQSRQEPRQGQGAGGSRREGAGGARREGPGRSRQAESRGESGNRAPRGNEAPPREEEEVSAGPREVIPVSKEAAERGAEFLRQALELMGIEATVEMEMAGEPYDEVVLQVDGEASGVVIGRHGQTIDAIEYVVNRLVAREHPSEGHIVVDAAGYRTRRRQSLTDMARRLADKAKRERRTVTLNPLSPRDRRVVHIALKNEKGISTRSHGAGLHKKLLIIPGGQSRRQGSEARDER
jgi:spoIIIJ-associated protein